MSDYKKIGSKIGFGKYCDKSIQWVMINNIAYLQWMINQENIRQKIMLLPYDDRLLIHNKLKEHRKHKQNRLELYAWLGI